MPRRNIPTQNKLVRGPVKLLTIHSSGRSLALTDDKKIYLDFGIPGEEVTFIIHRKKQGFRSGEITEIITPSPDRVKPFCLHHTSCNGCPWMHIDYNRQLELKHAILWNALNKYGIITPEVPPVIPSPILQHYRHRVEYTFSSKASTGMLQGETSPALGFHKNGEPGQVLDIHECFLQKEPSRAIGEFIKNYAVEHNLEFYDHTLKTGLLRSLSIRINGDNQVLVIIGFNEDKAHEREMLLESVLKRFPEIVSLNWTIHPSPVSSQLQGDIRTYGMTSPYFSELSGRYRFRIHPASFYQPNPPQADKIFQTIVEWAQLCGSEQIVDLYTGIGTIALYLAPFAKHVLGIEGSPVAIEDARENARMNDVFNAEFMTGDILKTFTADFLHRHGKPDVIVLDPPRSGTLIEIKKTINNSGANRVIYLSCNPVSLAFDLKQLCEVYRVVRIQPFDMLPQTHHLETLVLLERSSMQWQ